MISVPAGRAARAGHYQFITTRTVCKFAERALCGRYEPAKRDPPSHIPVFYPDDRKPNVRKSLDTTSV